jgi:hypothetical protein
VHEGFWWPRIDLVEEPRRLLDQAFNVSEFRCERRSVPCREALQAAPEIIVPVGCGERRLGDELSVGPIGEGDAAERLDGVDEIAKRDCPLGGGEAADDVRHRPAREPALDHVFPGFIDRLDPRRRVGEATIDRGKEVPLLPQLDDPKPPGSWQTQDAIRVERVDERLATGADERRLAQAEAVEDALVLGLGEAQFTVRLTSGRSSEKAGMAMLKSSPFSFCIW